MRVFVLDNYDSFTFNLVQAVGALGAEVVVRRNDEITTDDVALFGPDAVLISPGPGEPMQAGISVDLVGWCARTFTPLLGVCLGHQAIAVAFGAVVLQGPAVMHGKTSRIDHDGVGVFAGLPRRFEAMRYHSLVVDPASLGAELVATAWTPDGVLMGVRHERLPIEGVQFHPESVMTSEGPALLANFLATCATPRP